MTLSHWIHHLKSKTRLSAKIHNNRLGSARSPDESLLTRGTGNLVLVCTTGTALMGFFESESESDSEEPELDSSDDGEAFLAVPFAITFFV